MKKTIFFVLADALLLASGAPSAFARDDHNPIGVSGVFEGVITTGCAYNVLNHNARREIDDIVVPGSIGKYPLKMTRYYNSRGPGYTLMGPGWSHEYLWSSYDGKIQYPNGNVWDSSCFGDYGAPLGVSDWPTTRNGKPAFRLADGGTVVFGGVVVNGNTYYSVPTEIIDPYGQTLTITYYQNTLLVYRVTEPGDRYLQFYYNGPQAGLLSRVEAWDGRGTRIDWVNYTYAQKSPGANRPSVYCLIRVDYSDSQQAKYTYDEDNVPDNPPNSIKAFPLVIGCDDKRYHGPMRRVAYEYQDQGPHGAIVKERYWDGIQGHEASGYMVSKIDPGATSPLAGDPNFETTYTETRGDGNVTRTFTYTSLHLHRYNEDTCPTWRPDLDPAPQQFLLSYTDFQNHTTELDYDENWYVDSVTDANNHTTLYDRGPPPNPVSGPKGIGQIKRITHPDNTHIDYTYYDESPNISGHYLKQITDERGNITYHTRDGLHRITRTDYKDANGNVIAFEAFAYNNFGQVIIHQLKNGAYESFTYDGRGLLTHKYNPRFNAIPSGTDPHTHYDYYTSGAWTDRVKTMTLPANISDNVATETYEYDLSANNTSRGLVTKIQHADGKYQSFGYDVYGNKLWEENERRNRTSYTYDDYNRVLTIKDPIGQTTGRTTTYTYNPTNGTGSSFKHTTSNPDTVTTPAGIQTSNVYDENFRKTSTTVGTSTTIFGYDNVGNPTTVTDPLQHTTTTDYDARNRKWHVWDAQWQRSIFGYDPTNNVISITRPDNRIETKAYDGMNRLIRHTVPKSATESLTTTFGYWPSGKLFWVQDPKQQGGGPDAATYFEYNESDEMIRMWYPGRVQKQEWTYDDAHNLASHTTVGGKTEQFSYDIRNRKDTMTCGILNPLQSIEWADYGYDDVGRLTSAKNGTGAWLQNRISTVTRQYDDAGHLTLDQQDVNGLGSVSVSYPWYDDDGKLKRIYVPGASYDYTFGYDPIFGRFETISPTGGSVAFKYYYDAASNEIHRDNLVNGVTQIYNRDSLNRIWRLDVKKGATLLGREDYGYDAMNRLVSTTREDNKQDQYGYWWDGELLGVNYGANPTPTPSPPASPTPTPPGGQVAAPTFNPPGRNIYPAGSVTVAISTATAGASIRYTVDGGAHWTTIANNGTATFSPGLRGMTLTAIGFKSGMADSDPHSEDYYREDPGGPGMPETYRTVVYYYDGAGNRTSVNDNGIITTYTSTPLNQYDTVTASTISNGPEHEVRSYQGPGDAQPVNYTYLTDRDLVSVSSGSNNYALAYDALGRCVKRTLNNVTTFYFYDGEKPILEYNSNGTIKARNVYGKGIDEILMRTETGINGGQPFYYQQDHEGSVTHLTNNSGTVIEKYRYDVFGNPVTIYSAGTYNNRFKFTGREFNSTFGFYEYRARAYHPGLGRFMSEDPKLFDPGDYNLLRYCHNDPIDFTDPMGTQDTAPTYSPRQESFWRAENGVDITIAERISLWQKSMESSIGGEQAALTLQRMQFKDTLSRQLRGPNSALEQSPRFRAFIPFVLRWEGGYSNDRHDPGGETNFGIDARSHPGIDIRHLTKDGAEHIYWNEWGTSRAEALRYPLGEVHFNAYVNVGAGQAATLLRRSRGDPLSYVNGQEAFYRNLARDKPNFGRYLRGWINRSEDLKRYLNLEP